MGVIEQYVRELIAEDMAKRQAFAKDASDNILWAPGVHSPYDFEDQKAQYRVQRFTGRTMKKMFAKYADRSFLDSLITIHWGWGSGIGRLLEAYVSNKGSITKDELSAAAYLPTLSTTPTKGEIGAGYGLEIKGHITLLANDMDDLFTGSGDRYKQASPKHAAMSGANKGVGKTLEPRKYAEERSVLVFDKDDWSPSGSSTVPSNEALVDNWEIVRLIMPSKYAESYGKFIDELGLDIPITITGA